MRQNLSKNPNKHPSDTSLTTKGTWLIMMLILSVFIIMLSALYAMVIWGWPVS